MIFWFSGTGNSYAAAKEIEKRFGGELVYIPEALEQKRFQYEIPESERVFFVFPVYFSGMPECVRVFTENVKISGSLETVVVMTCGGGCAGADRLFEKAYRRNGGQVRAFYDLVMPDNCIFYLKTPIREEALMILKHSKDRMKDILDSIEYHHRMPYQSSFSGRLLSSVMHPLYDSMRGTSKFRVTEKCIGCGTCAKNCPDHAIEMRDGKPVWVKEKCEKCAGCMNRCPVHAIEYGNGTKKRFRYVHPLFSTAQGLEKHEQQK